VNFETLKASGLEAIAHMMGIAVSGTTTEEFEDAVVNWMASARHPETGREAGLGHASVP